jgi:hypothetical protein
VSSDLTCDHGTLLAAWCGQCSLEWAPEPVEAAPATAERSQNAA